MSMNDTPRASRLHIAFFGKRNVGKSSVINALTGQNAAIVSEVLGTTADPVFKSMEILPIGPCVIIDTAGFDDEGELGSLRVEKTLEVLSKTDLAVLITDNADGLDKTERDFLNNIRGKKIPVICVVNKSDMNGVAAEQLAALAEACEADACAVSAVNGEGIDKFKQLLIKNANTDDSRITPLDGLVRAGDTVLLITPIDSSAPKGRMILPQQQVIRDVLDNNALCVIVRETEIDAALAGLTAKPTLAVTDSQAFATAAKALPEDIPLTSFSILFARMKGDLDVLTEGVRAVERLKDGDKILIAEACTHHTQCDDIGRVKIPNMLKSRTGKNLIFEHTAGHGYKKNLTDYALIVHCGACMLNRRDILSRIGAAKEAGVPIVNYGVLLAYMTGILPRALAPLNSERTKIL